MHFAADRCRFLGLQGIGHFKGLLIVCRRLHGHISGEEIEIRSAQDLLLPETRESLEVPVDEVVPALQVLYVDDGGRPVENVLQPFLALRQGVLHLLDRLRGEGGNGPACLFPPTHHRRYPPLDEPIEHQGHQGDENRPLGNRYGGLTRRIIRQKPRQPPAEDNPESPDQPIHHRHH